MGLIVTPTRNAATDRVCRRRADRRIERHREQRTGSDIQSAIESPRFRWDVGSLGVGVESRISEPVIRDLRDRGHDVGVLPEWTNRVSGVNGITVTGAGRFLGGADPRRDGYVMGW